MIKIIIIIDIIDNFQTWHHRGPVETPPSPCTGAIRVELHLHHGAPACDVRRQDGAALLFHQDCPVPVHDCQVVIATCGTVFDIERSEF